MFCLLSGSQVQQSKQRWEHLSLPNQLLQLFLGLHWGFPMSLVFPRARTPHLRGVRCLSHLTYCFDVDVHHSEPLLYEQESPATFQSKLISSACIHILFPMLHTAHGPCWEKECRLISKLAASLSSFILTICSYFIVKKKAVKLRLVFKKVCNCLLDKVWTHIWAAILVSQV